tara:strand:+ start:72 stop:641 length:570 start_codon:yes stop_codon:yes gene_type:complete
MSTKDQHKKYSPYQYLRLTFSNWGFTWEGLLNNRHGEWLLICQLLILGLYLLPRPMINETIFVWSKSLIILSISLMVISILIGIKSFIDLGTNLSPLPEPKKGANLVTTGLYKYCRHPIYLSLILFCSGLTIYKQSRIDFFLLILLSFLLKYKAQKEENRLKEIYTNYKECMKSKGAIIKGIPFLDWQL